MSQTFTDDCYAGGHVAATDLTNMEANFAALKSAFSGATTPANTVAGMWWFDTTANILKLRNEANSAWLSVWDFANNKPILANNVSADFAAALKDPAAGTAGLRTLGTTAVKACAGNDARLSDTRTPPDASVSQVKLKTSQGSVNTSHFKSVGTYSAGNVVLPGGEYGFYPRIKTVYQAGYPYGLISARLATSYINASYATVINFDLIITNSGLDITYYAYVQQRYVTSSGEIHWIFVLRDKITKQTISTYQAPDHPCFGNGGKPSLVPHPFGNYDETKHELIVINPTLAEIEQMELETIVDDETEPDKDLLEIITENYEIDENSNPAWPSKPVTVGLPKHIKDKTGKKILADYRFMGKNDVVEPVKKVIPKPSYIKCKSLKRK